MDLYDSKCLICGTKENISIDHVDSLYNGGTNWMWNLQPLCLSDNKKKWKSSIDYRTEIELEAQLNLSNYLVWQKAQIESGNAPKIKDYNETR
jgi:5-methylcytosine-specific restriction endonuclease McrA